MDELFDRICGPQNLIGPQYYGQIDPNLKFPDLQHISQLGPEFNQWTAKWFGQKGTQKTSRIKNLQAQQVVGAPRRSTVVSNNPVELMTKSTTDIDFFKVNLNQSI